MVVVAVSGTVFVRPGAPARPAFTAGETPSRMRAPRPWAAALPRPAARILLAAWADAGRLRLLGAALAYNTASAAETTTSSCPHSSVSRSSESTVEHGKHGHHRTSRRDNGAATCAQQPKSDDGTKTDDTTQTDETPAAETKQSVQQQSVEKQSVKQQSLAKVSAKQQSTKDVQTDEAPSAKKTTTATSGGLLGGLVGGVLNVVGGTLTTVTDTVGAVTHTVAAVTDTLSHTVLAPLTQPSANNPDAPVLLPLDDILDPVLNGGSNAGGVTATVPDAVSGVVTQVTTPATETTSVATPTSTPVAATEETQTRTAVVHLVEVQNTLPAVHQEQPRDSGVHATGGGDSTPVFPASPAGRRRRARRPAAPPRATTAPAAPARSSRCTPTT